MTKAKFWKWALHHAVKPWDALRVFYFARFDKPSNFSGAVQEFKIKLNGKSWTLSFRPNSTDLGILKEIFCQGYYHLPKNIQPKTIVDIGGNVGYSIIYWASLYPEAIIHVFEPVPENVEMIHRQVDQNGLKQVTIHPYALGKKNGELLLSAEQKGQSAGFSACFVNNTTAIRVPVRDTREVFAQLGIDQIDLLKIDCEGGEIDIFDSLSENFDRIKVILGELHPTIVPMPITYSTLALLSRNYTIDFEKEWGQSSFMFSAILHSPEAD